MFVFNGVGLAFMGIALHVGRNAFTIGMMLSGCVAITIGLVLLIIHPAWAQPRWMGSPER